MNVQDNIYKRAVIVATNVAEASVTIPNLSFVIDNGYAKENRYDYKTNKVDLVPEKISESSRIQRKGRVGRIADGSVYYMYPKNARRYIKTKYKITQEKIGVKILELLCMYEENDLNKNDSNNYDKLIVNTMNIGSYKKSRLYDINKNNGLVIDDIINIFNVFNSGQLIDNLIDLYGYFYLIHPFENKIKRNVLNNIFIFNNQKRNSVNKDIYNIVFKNLLNRYLILDFNGKYIKSELGNIITDINKKIGLVSKSFDLNSLSLILIASYGMGCFTQVYCLIVMLDLLGLDIYKLFNIKSMKDKLDITNIYKNMNINSELLIIYNIIEKFKKNFSELIIFNITSQSSNLLNNENVINEFIKIRKHHNKPPIYYDMDVWNELNKLYLNNDLQNTNLQINKNNVFNEIVALQHKIINWCKSYNIDSKIMLNFLKRLGKNYGVNPMLYNNQSEIFKSIDKLIFNNYNKFLTTNSIDEKIIRSFIYGYPEQIGIRDKNMYITYYNNNIIKIIANNKMIDSTGFIFFLDYAKYIDEENEYGYGYNKIINIFDGRIVSNINPKWIIPANPLFLNPKYYNENNRREINKNGIIINSYKTENFSNFVRQIGNHWSDKLNIWNTKSLPLLKKYIETINKDIINIISK
jgi:hypothetical protein